MLSRSVMSQPRPIAGPQPEMPVPATPMPVPYCVGDLFGRRLGRGGVQRPRRRRARLPWPAGGPVALPMPLPAPMTTTTWRASSFSGGMRLSLASSSCQYSMSNASCCGSAIVLGRSPRRRASPRSRSCRTRPSRAIALVLAPGDHAEAGDRGSRSGSGRASPASRAACTARNTRRSRRGTASSAVGDAAFEPVEVAGRRVPGDVKRLDLGPQEVVRADRARAPRAAGASCAVDEPQHALVVLNGGDEPLLPAHLPAEPRAGAARALAPLPARAAAVHRAAERLRRRLSCCLDVAGRPLDQIERHVVARLVVVGPVDEAVLAEQDALRLRVSPAMAPAFADPARNPGRCQGV